MSSLRRPHHVSLRRLDGSIAERYEAASLNDALRMHLRVSKDLKGLDLRKARLAGLDLTGALLDGSSLAGADLTGCKVERTRFDRCDLSGVVAPGIHGRSPSFREATIGGLEGRGADFHGADIPSARFAGATVRRASFARARMHLADMSDAVLANCDMRGADLTGAEHMRARYENNDLSDARLEAGARPFPRGVRRKSFTTDTVAVGNTYTAGTVVDARVPAFDEDRRLTAVTRKWADRAALGVAAGAAAGVGVALDAAAGLDWAGISHKAGEAISATPLGMVDWDALTGTLATALRLREAGEVLSGYAHHAADALASVPGLSHFASLVADHPLQAATVVVTGAAAFLAHKARRKVNDMVKERLQPEVRRLVDKVRPMLADVAAYHGGLLDIAAAFMRDNPGSRLLLRALASTAAEPSGEGFGAAFRGLTDGSTTLVVCRYEHLNRALEWIATSFEATERLDHDVLLVRPGPVADGEPAALKFHARGGMTAFLAGAGGVRHETWTAEQMREPARLGDTGCRDVRRAFENAVLKDHLPGMPFEFDASRGLVNFSDDGASVWVSRHDEGDRKVHGRWAVDRDDPDGPWEFRDGDPEPRAFAR